MVGDGQEQARRRISLGLSEPLLERIEALKADWGLRGRGEVIERLLEQLFEGFDEALDDEADGPDDPAEPLPLGELAIATAAGAAAVTAMAPGPAPGPGAGRDPGDPGPASGAAAVADGTETGALVLVHLDLVPVQDQAQVPSETDDSGDSGGDGRVAAAPRRAGGIDLPGFVRRQGREIRRSLHPPRPIPGREPGLALISAEHLAEAAHVCGSHWLEIYGQPANAQALEAAMVWLAREIWPRSDQSEGRPFTWALTQQVLAQVATGWEEGPASFERVITAAGILEDPFSGGTLALRVPTLITRFVQWARTRQKRGASFHVLDGTLTVLGALRLLELPTDPNVPITLAEIREAYREQAQSHHPDAGGSADAMRRLNEAYQLLKDKYRKPS